jgi:hypothetical protein
MAALDARGRVVWLEFVLPELLTKTRGSTILFRSEYCNIGEVYLYLCGVIYCSAS